MVQGYNTKKPTKNQFKYDLVKDYENTLKENFIKNMVVGAETISNIYLKKIEEGCSIEELKDFIEKFTLNKEYIEKIITKKEGEENEVEGV